MGQITLAQMITLTDGAMTAGSAVLTSASAPFFASQVGAAVTVAKAAVDTTGTDGVMSSTVTPTKLTSAAAPFTVGMVGDWITVTGAGAAGADLVTTIAAFTSATVVTLASPALTDVAATNFAISDGTLVTSILSYQSAAQVTLADASSAIVVSGTVTISMGTAAIYLETSNYEVFALSSNLHAGDIVTVSVFLPDGQTAVLAPDVNGDNSGLFTPHTTRFYIGGPTYVMAKINTNGPAGLFADFGSRAV